MYNAIPRTTEANHGKAQGAKVSITRSFINSFNPSLKGKGKFYTQ